MMPSREITVPSKEKSQQPCRRTDGEEQKKGRRALEKYENVQNGTKEKVHEEQSKLNQSQGGNYNGIQNFITAADHGIRKKVSRRKRL